LAQYDFFDYREEMIMKRILNILFFIVLFVGSSFAGTVIDIPVFRDGAMDSVYEDGNSVYWNYNTVPRLGYDKNNDRHYRGWLLFDLSSIQSIPEGQAIVSAEVRVELSYRIGSHVDLFDVSDADQLSEGGTTWNDAPSIGEELQRQAYLAPSDYILKFDSQAISDAVKANHDAGESYWGCVMKERISVPVDGYATWYARESGYGPILRVTIDTEPPLQFLGDIDNNGIVDVNDLEVIIEDWLFCGFGDPNVCP
jgi:hypothetical protein